MRMKMVCDDRTLREISNEFLALKKAQKIRDRTLSLRFWRPPLYQLSYTPIYKRLSPHYLWWAFRDSNPGLSGYEPEALTN